MFLLCPPQQVCRETDLCFDILFAVTKIIVSNQGNHDPGGIPASHFETTSVIVNLALIFPAHSVPFLQIGCVLYVREAQFFFSQRHQVRGKNDATCVSGPMKWIQRCIILRKIRITCIPKNRFNKIKVGDQATRNKKTGFQ